jgi:hypothetical protein
VSGESRHGPDCPCPRCRGFEPGNQLSKGHGAPPVHGAYATLRLGARAPEIADALRGDVPGYRASDEPTLLLLGVTLARIEAAVAAVDDAVPAELERLRSDLRGWVNTARRLLNDLGMSPTARARLGVDVAVAKRAWTLTEIAEQAEAERERGRDVVEGGERS